MFTLVNVNDVVDKRSGGRPSPVLMYPPTLGAVIPSGPKLVFWLKLVLADLALLVFWLKLGLAELVWPNLFRETRSTCIDWRELVFYLCVQC